jgi:hypothetical protein
MLVALTRVITEKVFQIKKETAMELTWFSRKYPFCTKDGRGRVKA